jgi:hypothetical protein
MNREEFYDYIIENFTLSPEAARIINSILFYIESRFEDVNDQRIAARDLLGSIDLEDVEFNLINF